MDGPTAAETCPLHPAAALAPAIRGARDQFFGVAGEFHYAACPSCGTLVLTPRPADLGPYYAPYYPAHHLQHIRDDAARRGRIRSPMRLRALGYLRQIAALGGGRPGPQTRLLDVGCGLGMFMRFVRDLTGAQVRGVDYDPVCREFAAEMHGITVDRGELRGQQYAEASFDLVTAWHVLEHVTDPAAELREMARVLKPGGWLMVETPTPSVWRRVFGRRWLYLQPPTHLFHWAPEVLAELVRGAGLEVRAVKRPWFPGELAGSLWLALGFRGFVPRFFQPPVRGWNRWLRALFLLQMIVDIPVSLVLARAGKGGIVRVYAQKPGIPGAA